MSAEEHSLTKRKDQALANPPSKKPKISVLIGKPNVSANLGFDKGARMSPTMKGNFWGCLLYMYYF